MSEFEKLELSSSDVPKIFTVLGAEPLKRGLLGNIEVEWEGE
jgi:hypothetical protein